VQTPASTGKINKVWIDLDNSPHVPFFMPIIARLEEMRCSVEITARDCFQVCGLADRNKLKYRRIGKHYGKNVSLKITGTLFRAMQLLPFAMKVKPIVAISHGSRAMTIAAGILNINTVVITDYEFSQEIPFMYPSVLITPEVVSLQRIIGRKTKWAKYPGIKEDVYVPFFKPDRSIVDELGLGEDKIIVTIRPPATEAHYHNPESEGLFIELLKMLSAIENVKMVILPRDENGQKSWIIKNWQNLIDAGKIVIPSQVVDGLNLIWHSDFVVSGGGTMNREAAALGVPVYSIFRGAIGGVDHYLANTNRLVLLESVEDVRKKIKVCKRSKGSMSRSEGAPALEAILSAINAVLNNGSAASL
jgi:uncharacterized protein